MTEPRILIMNHNLIEGANQGSKGQERSLRICFSKRINYLGQILRSMLLIFYPLLRWWLLVTWWEGRKERGRKGHWKHEMILYAGKPQLRLAGVLSSRPVVW